MKLTVTAPDYRSLTLETIAQKRDSIDIVIELETKPDKPKPVLIEGLPVWIAEETNIELNDGRVVTKAQYTEYSKEEVRKRVIDLNDLTRVWTNQRKREEFMKELVENSVKPKILATIVGAMDADPYDLLAHIAFGAPLITRDNRSEWFVNNKEMFIKSFGESGKQIILDLLEKYRMDGIDNVVDPKVFDLSPFNKMGHVIGVADKVGGIENLKKIIVQIESGLYKNE